MLSKRRFGFRKNISNCQWRLILIFTHCCFNGFSQKIGQQKIDSLITAQPKIKVDTVLINNWIEIAKEYHNITPDSAIHYSNLALEKSKKIKWITGEAIALNSIGGSNSRKGAFDKALNYFNQSLTLAKQTGDSLNLAKNFQGIALVYRSIGDTAKALQFINTAIEINIARNDKYLLANCYNFLGILSVESKQYDKAIKFYDLALAAALESGNKTIVAYAYSNSGGAYSELKQFQKALELNFKSLAIEKEMGDDYGVATEYSSIAGCYMGLYNQQKDKSKSLLMDSAIYYLQTAIELAKKCDIPTDRANMLVFLADIYKQKNDFKKAYELLMEGKSLKDSIFSTEKQKEIRKAETQREVSLREKEIEIQKLELQKNTNEKIVLIGGLSFLLLLIVLIFRNFKKQQAINKQLKSTQTQLVQSEKLAAFGTMATRMAHEIQNPLNFVNNFSELSVELVDEIVSSKSEQEKIDAAKMLVENLEKINQHGKRASAIISSLQEHSNKGTAHEYFEKIN